jgi:hypothetical protein
MIDKKKMHSCFYCKYCSGGLSAVLHLNGCVSLLAHQMKGILQDGQLGILRHRPHESSEEIV